MPNEDRRRGRGAVPATASPARWRPLPPSAGAAGRAPAAGEPTRGEAGGTGTGTVTRGPRPRQLGRARTLSSARKRWISASSAFCNAGMRVAWWYAPHGLTAALVLFNDLRNC